MKQKLSYFALLMGALLLQACGGGGGLAGNAKDSTDPLIPLPVVDDGSDRPRPSDSALVIKSDGSQLKDVQGKVVYLRGANIEFGAKPFDRFKNITAIRDVRSNVVRLQLSKTTKKEELEGALVEISDKGMVALLTLVDSTLTCKDDTDALDGAVNKLWLDTWLSVIAQDRFQPHLMINYAHQWGPKSVFTENTVGYGDYIEAHKLAIRQFRKAGLRVPLVIDASGCGQDYFSFTAGRSRELKAADEKGNIVLSVHAFGESWNTDDRVRTAITKLSETNMPIVMSGMGGTGVDAFDIDIAGIIKKAIGDGGLVLNIPWQTSGDKAAYSIALDSPLFLTGGSLKTDVYIPKTYTDNGKLGIVLYLKDAQGRYANTGWTQASNLVFNSWNKLSFKLTSVAALKESGAYVEDGFDLGAVQKIGYEIVANGKPVDVSAPLIIDNLTVYPGIPPVYKKGFDTGADEWDKDWGPFDVASADGKLSITPTGGGDGGINLQGWKAPSFYDIPLSKPLEVAVRIFVPATYSGDTNLGMKIYGKDAGWGWIDGPSSSLASYAGTWATVKLNVDFSGAKGPANAFGIQFYGLGGAKAEPMLIDWIEIYDPSKKNTKIINAQQLGATFGTDNEAFSVIWDKQASAVVANGVMEVSNTNVSGDADVAIGKGDINSKQLNLTGPITIKAKVFIPESFAGNTDFFFNFFMQDSNWSHYSFPAMKIDQFQVGKWTEIEIVENAFTPNFNRKGSLQHFGFQFGGPVKGTIKIDDIQIWGNVEIEDAKPILTIGFESQAEIDKVKYDYSQGGLSESALSASTAKFWGSSTLPFSWIANTWKGSDGLDLSNSESAVDLTARGETIVNGVGGIKQTSAPVNFK